MIVLTLTQIINHNLKLDSQSNPIDNLETDSLIMIKASIISVIVLDLPLDTVAHVERNSHFFIQTHSSTYMYKYIMSKINTM